VGEKGRSVLVCTENKNSSAQQKLTQVIDELTSPEVLGKIIPIFSDKIS
jgi:hypothetical protein